MMSNTISTSQKQLKEISPINLHRIAGGGSNDKDSFSPPPSPPPVVFDKKGGFDIPQTPFSGKIGGTDEFAKIEIKCDIGNNFYISGKTTTDYHNFGNNQIYAGAVYTWK